MKSVQIALILSILFAFDSLSFSGSQVTSENNNFIFSIKLQNDFVTITNMEGCKFVRIGFLLNQDEKPIGFNQFGMFDAKRYKKQSQPGQFSFFVRRNEKGLLLEGLDGVEWKNLLLEFNGKGDSFSYLVNQYGAKEQ